MTDVMDVDDRQQRIAQTVHSYAVYTEANLACRPTMEDTHCTMPHFGTDLAFFAVFDGHGGREAADCAAECMHKHLATRLSATSKDLVHERIFGSYLDTDASIKAAEIQFAGCTAATALVSTEYGQLTLYAANAGDARIVLMRGNDAVRLTVDHKPNVQSERDRIRDAGGHVAFNRVNGTLAVSRSLGDHSMKDLVIGDPDITPVVLEDTDRFFIIACDGLWDVMEDQEACDFVKTMATTWPRTSLDDICTSLGERALAKESRDNITIVLVWL